MAQLLIEIALDNDTFRPLPTEESVKPMLDKVAREAWSMASYARDPMWNVMNLFDLNGNNVGTARVVEE